MIVSIIVPIYNAEKYLEQCIISIIEQTYKYLDIILVNDGSTDNSLQICEKYSEIDDRIHIINKKNGGVSSARNMGIENSIGNYIIFIDSDDWIETEYVDILIKTIKSKNGDLAICGYNIASANGQKRQYTPSFSHIQNIDQLKNHFPKQIDNRLFLSPAIKIYRKEIIEKNNVFFDETKSLGEDLLFNLKYLTYTNMISANQLCLYNYRMTKDDSLTKKIDENRIDNTEYIFKKGIDFSIKMNMEDICWIFSKLYFKSHLNFLERLLVSGVSKHQVNNYIEKIVNQDSMKIALLYTNVDKELCVYNYLFKNKSYFLIKSICEIRLFIKKYIRKF